MPSPTLITPRARLSFPWLFEAQPSMQPGGQAKFGATLLFPETTDLSALKNAAKAARDAMWPNKTDADGKIVSTVPKNFRSPFRKGSEKDLDGYAGTIFIACTSKSAPGVLGMAKQEISKLLGNSDEVYAGCYVIASINAYSYSKAGNNGVAFGLNNIMKVGDGDRFAGRTKAVDDFAEVAAQQNAKAAAKSGAATAVADEWDDGAAGGEPDL